MTSFDWTPFTLDVTVPADCEGRWRSVLHVYSRFTGTIYWDDLTIDVIGTATAVADPTAGVPTAYELGQNYPNPFNPSTTISYGVPQSGEVTLVVYDMLGQQVRELAHGYASAGRYTVTWDGHDDQGRAVGFRHVPLPSHRGRSCHGEEDGVGEVASCCEGCPFAGHPSPGV